MGNIYLAHVTMFYLALMLVLELNGLSHPVDVLHADTNQWARDVNITEV